MTFEEIYAQMPMEPSQRKETNWRYLYDAMELALSLGDIQKESSHPYSRGEFCEMALGGINKIIQFNASAIYIVESNTSDLKLSAFTPKDQEDFIEKEMGFLIDQGLIAWAIREKRGITVFSQDGSHQLVLHVIATYARIRGIFIGLYPSRMPRKPDGASEFLSLMLRNVATSLESIEYIDLLKENNGRLHQLVDEKMGMLLHRERELANARKLNAIASLAGGIAHEYNNALASLIGYNDLLQINFSNSDKTLGYAEKSAPLLNRMASLTSQLLSYSRGSKYRTETIRLKTLIEDSLAALKGKMKGPIDVDVKIEDNELCINCDVKQIHQVLSAVIINAKEAIEGEGEIRITAGKVAFKEVPEQVASNLEPGDHVMLEIKDNGCGMDPETRDRIFEPFFSTKFKGRGLSMAAVYGILESHHGAIIVESKTKAGTRVKIYLPVAAGGAGRGADQAEVLI